MGEKTYEKYGRDLSVMVTAHRKKHGIEKITMPDICDIKLMAAYLKTVASKERIKD